MKRCFSTKTQTVFSTQHSRVKKFTKKPKQAWSYIALCSGIKNHKLWIPKCDINYIPYVLEN